MRPGKSLNYHASISSKCSNESYGGSLGWKVPLNLSTEINQSAQSNGQAWFSQGAFWLVKNKIKLCSQNAKSGKTSENRRTRSVWTLFFSFFRRSGIFIKYMKSAKIRRQFEVYLQTIGRDPTCFKKEGWSDIRAVTLDSALPHDIGNVRKISCFEYLVSFLSLGKVYHRKKYNGSYIIGEFVLNDFRFWREMECFKRQAVYLSKSTYREVLPQLEFLKLSCVQTKKCLWRRNASR